MGIKIRIRDGMCPDPTTGDGGATEGDIRGSYSDMIDTIGVVDLANGHCLVTENTPAALSVLIAPGIVYIPNADYDELDSDEPKFYEAIIDAEAELEIAENTSGSTRVDLVCVKIDKTITPDEHASNIATLIIVQGTPGAGAPTLPDNHAKLAEIEVADSASTIVTADITDSRVQSKFNQDYESVTPTSVTVLTGKTFDDELRLKQIATPTDPATGYNKLYFKSDGKLYYLDENSVETEVGAGGGGDSYSSIFRQALINGNFDVWQRGTSLSVRTSGSFIADRWKEIVGAADWTPPTVVSSRQTLTPGELNGSYYFYRFAPNGPGTITGGLAIDGIATYIEHGTRYLCGLNKKVTVSFWARSSIANKKLGVYLSQRYGSGGSPTASETIIGTNWTLTSTWTKYTHTFTTNTLTSKTFGTANDDNLMFLFANVWGDNFKANVGDSSTENYVGAGNIDIAQVQLCAGDVALPFMPKSFEEELRACQRYYEKSYNYAVAPGTNTTAGLVQIGTSVDTAGKAWVMIPFKANKRGTPTISVWTASGTASQVEYSANGGAYGASTNYGVEREGTNHFCLNATGKTGGQTGTIAFHYQAVDEI